MRNAVDGIATVSLPERGYYRDKRGWLGNQRLAASEGHPTNRETVERFEGSENKGVRKQ